MELVEEPLSGALVPARLQHTDAHPSQSPLLLCCGLRTKRIAMIEIQIYVLGVYGDPEAIFGRGASFSSQSDDPVNVLHTSAAEKVFIITLLRSVTGEQIVAGLGETLVKLAGVPREQIEVMAPLFPEKADKGAEVRIIVRPADGYFGVGDSKAVHAPEVVRGLHDLYFGKISVVKGLSESLHRQSPWLARLPEQDQEPDSPHGGLAESDFISVEEPSDSQQELQQTPCMASIPSGSLSEQKSWRESSGRTSGKDGYKFGDFTRTLVQKGWNRVRADSGDGVREQGTGSASTVLTVEVKDVEVNPGEGEPSTTAAWVAVEDVPCLSSCTLAEQSLEAWFYKHHSSPLRGTLVPQWSLRRYELKAGVLRYRRKEGGKLSPGLSLDGARVVAEPPKTSGIGDCFVFRIVMGSEVVARLSNTDGAVAMQWVLATAAACAYFRPDTTSAVQATVHTPPVEECEASAADAGVAVTAENMASEAPACSAVHSERVAVRAPSARAQASLPSRLAAFFDRCYRMDPRAFLTAVLPLLVALFAVRRLRRRAILAR